MSKNNKKQQQYVLAMKMVVQKKV